MSRIRDLKAFTLVELMVVLVVAGILLSVGASAFRATVDNSTDSMGPQVIAAAEPGLRRLASANDYLYPASSIGNPSAPTPVMDIGGVPVVVYPALSTVPDTPSGVDDFTLAVTFPTGTTTTSTALAMAVATTPGVCFASVERTTAAGSQLSSASFQWESPAAGGCVVLPVCLDTILADTTPAVSVDGVRLDDPSCEVEPTFTDGSSGPETRAEAATEVLAIYQAQLVAENASFGDDVWDMDGLQNWSGTYFPQVSPCESARPAVPGDEQNFWDWYCPSYRPDVNAAIAAVGNGIYDTSTFIADAGWAAQYSNVTDGDRILVVDFSTDGTTADGTCVASYGPADPAWPFAVPVGTVPQAMQCTGTP